MTAAIFRSTPSLSVPQTQNTAPVLEFACLYTHDIRKKTKRWNDGVLRYHTFNKRAMVYDVPRNFIGDMHWTGEEDIQEGNEVTLEKAGVKVEVAERIGQTETDLSELRAKKGAGVSAEPKKRVERAEFGAAAPSVARASSGATPRGNTQLKHRSLNALLGTPKGPIGKAKLPTKSPFEERYADVENEAWENGRPPKKARVAETRPSNTSKQDGVPLWARTSDSKADQQQQQDGSKIFIDLSDDAAPSNEFLPGFSSDALAPSSPARAAVRDTSGSSSSPAVQARQSGAVSGPAAARERPRASRMQDLEDIEQEDRAVESARRLAKSRKSPELARQPSPQPQRPSSVKPGQTLRLAASAPKKRTLLCQDQLIKKPRMRSPENCGVAVEEAIHVVDSDDRPKTAHERIAQRLEKINQKKTFPDDSGAVAQEAINLVDNNDRPKTAHERIAQRLEKINQKKTFPDNSGAAAQEAISLVDSNDRPKTAHERIAQRLEKINKKKARTKNALETTSTTVSKAVPKNLDSNDDTMSEGFGGARPSREMPDANQQRRRKADSPINQEPSAAARPRTSPDTSHETFGSGMSALGEDFGQRSSHETSAIELARLDRMMLPPAAPRRAPTPPVPIPSPREVRPLRRVISEPPNKPAARPVAIKQSMTASKRVPGAPVRDTPTPSPTKRSREPTPAPPAEKEARASFKNKSKKNLQKSVSLNVTAAGTSTVILGRPFQAPGKPSTAKSKKPEPPPEDVGPWSREAFDLFKWRPPGWDEEKWCVAEGEKTTAAPAGLSGGASLPSFLKEKNS